MRFSMKDDRLQQTGWSSLSPERFLYEPGRQKRDLSGFFVPLLKDFCKGKSVLELCSGSGRLVIQLATAGYQVTGIDLDERMLDHARRQLEAEADAVKDNVRFLKGDMCTFKLGQTFDFIILEDDGFLYLLDQDDQMACLQRVGEHLADDGCFLLAFNTPHRELASGDGYSYDPVKQIKTVQEHEWTLPSGERVKEGFERRRLTYPCEFELLLKNSGLEPIHRWGDLHRNDFSDPVKQEYIYLIQRANETRCGAGSRNDDVNG